MSLLHKVPFRLFGECELHSNTLKCIYFTFNLRASYILISLFMVEYFSKNVDE